MITKNNISITPQELKELTRLLDGTDYQGVSYDKGMSLMVYGFVYDSQTNEVISTHPQHVWEVKEVPIMFGVRKINTHYINELYMLHKEEVDVHLDDSMSWVDLCDSYKINLLEQSTGCIELRSVNMNMDIEELFEFLKTKL